MGHHTGHLTFSARRFDHSAIDIHWTTWKRERIDVSGVDNLEVILKFGMLELRRNGAHQSPTYSFDVTPYFFIAKQGKLLLSLLCGLTPEFHIILNAVFVAVIANLRLRQGRQRHHADRCKSYPGN